MSSFHITFANDRVATVFGSMAEGMEEVQRDNEEFEVADNLNVLALNLWDGMRVVVPGEPIVIEFPVKLHEAALGVLENCLDNSSGLKRDWVEADQHLFTGDVTIEPLPEPTIHVVIFDEDGPLDLGNVDMSGIHNLIKKATGE